MASAPSTPTGRAISHGARADPPPYRSGGGGSTSTTDLLVMLSVRVPLGDVEVRAEVAVDVAAGGAVGGLGLDDQLV